MTPAETIFRICGTDPTELNSRTWHKNRGHKPPSGGEQTDPSTADDEPPSGELDSGSGEQTELATLRTWVGDNLKGKQRRVMKLLIEKDGKHPIADLGTDGVISWQAPWESAWNSMQTTLNGKLKPVGWRVERQSNEARLLKLGAQK